MVTERVIGIAVTTETLLPGIIIMIHLAAGPVTVAFNAEMVVALGGKAPLDQGKGFVQQDFQLKKK